MRAMRAKRAGVTKTTFQDKEIPVFKTSMLLLTERGNICSDIKGVWTEPSVLFTYPNKPVSTEWLL